MALMDMESATHAKLIATSNVMRQFAGSDASRAALELFDTLSASYCLELINVTPESLARVQSALKQVALLRSVFANEGRDIPRI